MFKAIKKFLGYVVAFIVATIVAYKCRDMYKAITIARFGGEVKPSEKLKKNMKIYEAMVRKTDKEDLIKRYKKKFGA